MNRALGGWHAGALVVASMIGSGVFTTSGFLLAEVGDPGAVLWVWVLGGVLALAGAAVYGELGAMLPRVGGDYVYLARAFPPVVAFLAGWVALLVGFAAPIAASAVAFGKYLGAIVPGLPETPVALGLVAVVTAAHAYDVVWAGRFQIAFSIGTVGAVLCVIVAGGAVLLFGTPVGGAGVVATGAGAGAALPAVGVQGLAVGLVLVSYSYLGWNAAGYVAGELRAPEKTLPRALFGGCALVTVLYVAINAVFLAAVPAATLVGKLEVAHLAAARLFGAGPARALSALIAFVLAGSVSAFVMTGPRIYLAMAEDGLFPRLFARRNARSAPSAGVILQGVLAVVLAASATFEALLTYVGFTLGLTAAAAIVAAVVLRRREPDLPRPFRTPLWPVTPAVFFLLSAWMTVYGIVGRPRETAAGAATIALGAVVYAIWRRRAPAA